MKNLKFLFLCIFLTVFAACEKGETKISQEELLYGKKDTIVLHPCYLLAQQSFKNESGSGTPGSLPGGGLVENVNLYVFNQEGDLVSYRYCQDGDPLELEIYNKMKYSVYAVANAGKRLPVTTVSEIEKLEYTGPAEEISGNMPGSVLMAGKTPLQTLSGSRSIPVDLVRCVAKVIVRADFSNLYPDVGLHVKKIGIRNVPRRVCLFKENVIAFPSDAVSGTTYDSVDRDRLKAGLSFYTWENRQGTLLPGNLEQSGKVWPAEDIHSKICTYLEIEASYESPRKKGDILYRFYLGTDMVSNFDVLRNRQHNLTVFFKGNGAVDENTWRVDNSQIIDLVVSIGLDPAFYKFTALENTKQLIASVLPETADNRTLSWSSSDPSVATVNQNGIVTSRGDGSCTITASSTDGTNVSSSCTVEVDSKIYVTGVSVYPEELILFTGEAKQLAASVDPSGATVPELIWSSSNPAIAEADGSGKVRGVSAGACAITVTSRDDTSKRAVCKITVQERELSVDPVSKTLYVGEKFLLKYSANPPAAAVFTSSDPAVATVSQRGEVTAVKAGTATIGVSAAGRRAVCSVTVVVPQIAFPGSGRVMYDGETVTVPYAVLVPSAIIPDVSLSNGNAEILNITSKGISIRAKTAGACRMTAKIGNVSAVYDLDIQELKIVFNDPAPLVIYRNFKKEISYTVYPEHARTLSVELNLQNRAQDESYIDIIPGKNSIMGKAVSNSSRPFHYITAGFTEYPAKIFTTFCKVKDSRVMNDTVKLVANRALSRYYNDPLSKSEGLFAVDTDPSARPVWKIEGTDQIIINPNGSVSLAGNKTALNGVYNASLSITGDNGKVMSWGHLKVIVYEELNLYSLLVANETGMSGDNLVYDEWRESALAFNPLSPFWKKNGYIYPDIIYIPPWDPVVNGSISVVSDVTTAYYPIDSPNILSPSSIEISDKNRWTLNTEKGCYFYITSHPLYQATESYWRIFYPEG